MNRYRFLTALVILALAGCSGSGRYSLSEDEAPEKPISVEHIEDVQPVYEPYSRGGNGSYTVRGGSYTVLKNPEGFRQKGIASWYGKKFHGHQTSNGEVYDMYSMSAAHKTLPIPSYVKVTNLDNGKTAIVRLNDRGPFHKGRIIDLSYAAAYKLGVIATGTANVEIEHISVKKTNDSKLQQFAIQVAASGHQQRTQSLADTLSAKLSVSTFIEKQKNNFRVMVGPFDDFLKTEAALEKIRQQGYPEAFIKKVSQ
ncbi:septal ring lytic transglycosylase RlpA family protein [Vibrio sp. JC009]|uniref:septal ring lytic transglycosylase RlpA family protein n=1 Tax=Vibrio sp. JC009 TaxID=2912314 RepID=UPI0023AF51B6|nr:septal ring lytic transglycosylase RlpA family protein [Vibrio sp. JC009]WED23271.1 septal ring lytic transglycosylase RlpA family protein [Vibrio sp. JC009]